MDNKDKVTSIDEYINHAPEHAREILSMIRKIVKEEAPEATEKISYGMLTFYLHGNLIHFSANKHHIGIYPLPKAVETFMSELAPYHYSKGTIGFSYDKDIPYDLIRRIVKYRINENRTKTKFNNVV